MLQADPDAVGVSKLALEAAGAIASSELVEPLESLIAWWDMDTEPLHAALKRCRSEPCPDDDWRSDITVDRKS